MTAPTTTRAKLGIICDNAELAVFENQMAAATAGTAQPRSKIDFRRCYMSTNNPASGNTTWTSNSPGGNIAPFAAAGYGLFVSFNTAASGAATVSSWQTLIAGGTTNFAFQTKLANIIAFCEYVNTIHPSGTGQEHYISFYHEPERDTGLAVASGAWHNAGDAYRAAQEYIYPIWKANAPANWYFTQCLQYNTLNTPTGAVAGSQATCIYPNRTNTDARRWYSPACDVTGLDGPYGYRGSADGGPGTSGGPWVSRPDWPPLGQGPALYATPSTRWYNPSTGAPGAAPDPDKNRHWCDFAALMGGPEEFVIGEVTCYILDPAGVYPPLEYGSPRNYDSTPQGLSSSPEVAERADWISAWAEYWSADPRCKLVCWYERDQQDGWANGRISGGTLPAEPVSLRAFAAIANGYTTEPPPDPDPTGLFVPGVVPPMTRIKWG